MFISHRNKDTFIAKAVHEIMDNAVNDDAQTMNLTVLKSQVEYGFKGNTE